MSSDSLAAKRRGYVLVAIAACGWGTWPLILKHAPMPPALQSAVMMTVLTVASLPVMARDRVRVRATAKQWLGIAWLGVADAGNAGLFFAAYQRTSVAVAVLTHYLTPIFVALAAPVVLGERARPRTYGAVAIAFGGLVLLLEPWRAGLGRDDLVGAALGAGSAVFYASNVLVNKRLVPAFSGSEMMFFHGLFSVPILFAMVPAGTWADVPPYAWKVMLLGALGPGAACGLLFVWGLRAIPASHASVLALLEPLVAVVLAAVVIRERLGAVPMLGAAAILTGAALAIGYNRRGDGP
ncbi:MAG TPA: DMT family transporter [Labilithrix sp.]|jgi:drug/metabolite transporter (DMT)-like permease